MFRATILPIIRSTRMYNAACGMNYPMSCPPLTEHRPTTHWVIHTTSCIIQSSAPDDGQNCCPNHVELI